MCGRCIHPPVSASWLGACHKWRLYMFRLHIVAFCCSSCFCSISCCGCVNLGTVTYESVTLIQKQRYLPTKQASIFTIMAPSPFQRDSPHRQVDCVGREAFTKFYFYWIDLLYKVRLLNQYPIISFFIHSLVSPVFVCLTVS